MIALLGRWRLLSIAARRWILAGFLVVVAGAGFAAGWKIATWRAESELVALMERRIAQVNRELEEARERAKKDQKAAAELSRDLEAVRRARDLALDELDARPTLTRTITKVVTDETPCTCDTLGRDFRLRWNAPLAAGRDSAAAPDPD